MNTVSGSVCYAIGGGDATCVPNMHSLNLQSQQTDARTQLGVQCSTTIALLVCWPEWPVRVQNAARCGDIDAVHQRPGRIGPLRCMYTAII